MSPRRYLHRSIPLLDGDKYGGAGRRGGGVEGVYDWSCGRGVAVCAGKAWEDGPFVLGVNIDLLAKDRDWAVEW